MSAATNAVGAVQNGNGAGKAAHELLLAVHDELRRLAAHKLANEALGRLRLSHAFLKDSPSAGELKSMSL
ncbi:MAG TPA: ECF-type sigma factor [Candidatus Acidoferrum sp.]|jgi:hypothetical protein|nr:ECF-type sigma factor [Candidatus Acidoferrum sp.]